MRYDYRYCSWTKRLINFRSCFDRPYYGLYQEKLFLEARLGELKEFLKLNEKRLKEKPKRESKLIKQQQRLLERLAEINKAIERQELKDKKEGARWHNDGIGW